MHQKHITPTTGSIPQSANGLMTIFSIPLFSAEEQNNIKTAALSTPASDPKYDSTDTKDRVFLLSNADVQNTAYGLEISTDLSSVKPRTVTVSAYAKCQGYGSGWWLRSGGSSSGQSCVVWNSIYTTSSTDWTSDGVRPALLLKSLNTSTDVVIEQNGYIVSVPGVPGEKIIAAVNSNAKIYKDNKEVKLENNTRISTGMKLVTLSGGKITSSKDIVILGDVDGNGEVNVSDARLALRAAVKLDTPTGVYEIAAKIGYDEISVSVARLILRAAVKLDNPKDWLK
jgi:hypothetical protein